MQQKLNGFRKVFYILKNIIKQTNFTSGKGNEIFNGFWNSFSEKTDFDSSDAFASYFNVEKYLEKKYYKIKTKYQVKNIYKTCL